MRLLDLFCGAGGCTKGYQRTGFWVRGVDLKPQPRYCGEEFVQADALEYLRGMIDNGQIREFDVIHASPPCQDYSSMRAVTGKSYPRLIDPIRELCQSSGLPYIIENVAGSPIRNQPLFGTHAIILCGNSFGLRVYRHRRFESNLPLQAPPHRPHTVKCAKQGRPAEYDGQFVTVTGNCSGADYARSAMGIDWMVRDELSQAIPPAYTEFIGQQLMAALRVAENGAGRAGNNRRRSPVSTPAASPKAALHACAAEGGGSFAAPTGHALSSALPFATRHKTTRSIAPTQPREGKQPTTIV